MTINHATDHAIDVVTEVPKEPTLQEKFDSLWAYFRGEFAIVQRSARLDSDGWVYMTIAPGYDTPKNRTSIQQKLAEVGIVLAHFTNDGPRTPVDQTAASVGTATMNVLETTEMPVTDIPKSS